MPKTMIKVGNRYGMLTVIETGHHIGNAAPASLVRCDCGSEPKLISNYRLSHGYATHCGCSRKYNWKDPVAQEEHLMVLHDQVRKYGKDQLCPLCGMSNIYAAGICKCCYMMRSRGKKADEIRISRRFRNIPEAKRCIRRVCSLLSVEYKDIANYFSSFPGAEDLPVRQHTVSRWKTDGSMTSGYVRPFLAYVKTRLESAETAADRYFAGTKHITEKDGYVSREDMWTYTKYVRDIRRDINLNIYSLGDECGVSGQCVSAWLRTAPIPRHHMKVIDAAVRSGIKDIKAARAEYELLIKIIGEDVLDEKWTD